MADGEWRISIGEHRLTAYQLREDRPRKVAKVLKQGGHVYAVDANGQFLASCVRGRRVYGSQFKVALDLFDAAAKLGVAPKGVATALKKKRDQQDKARRLGWSAARVLDSADALGLKLDSKDVRRLKRLKAAV